MVMGRRTDNPDLGGDGKTNLTGAKRTLEPPNSKVLAVALSPIIGTPGLQRLHRARPRDELPSQLLHRPVDGAENKGFSATEGSRVRESLVSCATLNLFL